MMKIIFGIFGVMVSTVITVVVVAGVILLFDKIGSSIVSAFGAIPKISVESVIESFGPDGLLERVCVSGDSGRLMHTKCIDVTGGRHLSSP
jgi:hypothetical protein